MGVKAVVAPFTWFTCGNSAVVDGEKPGPDSPCKTERATGRIANIEAGGRTRAIQEREAKKAGWVFRHKVPYCPACAR